MSERRSRWTLWKWVLLTTGLIAASVAVFVVATPLPDPEFEFDIAAAKIDFSAAVPQIASLQLKEEGAKFIELKVYTGPTSDKPTSLSQLTRARLSNRHYFLENEATYEGSGAITGEPATVLDEGYAIGVSVKMFYGFRYKRVSLVAFVAPMQTNGSQTVDLEAL